MTRQLGPLLRLIKEFSQLQWRREAEAMLVVLGRGDAIRQALDRDNCEIKNSGAAEPV